MLDSIISFSLNNRFLVLVLSILLFVAGVQLAKTIPVDVLPDLTAPTVTIMTDGHGLAPEEVETLITRPIEGAINGATGVRRVRSNSTFELSTIWIEFFGGTDIYRARQIVNEKLQLVTGSLPPEVVPQMAPISSIMGEIMTIGMYSPVHTPMQVKEAADFIVRKKLLSIPGVSQVVNVGGETKQYRIIVDPQKLQSYNISLLTVVEAARKMNENFSAGVMKTGGQDYLIRGTGRVKTLADIDESVVTSHNGIPILMRDIASISIAPEYRVGDTSVNASPSVLLSVLKHPDVNTLDLTRRVEKSMKDLEKTLPPGMILDTEVFRQSSFIQLAIENVNRVLVEGAVLVVIILLLFLGNLRSTLISLTAIPLSLVFSVFVFKIFDMNLNTMTLGGIAIAIGVIVDDAIIDVENVFRRLQENAAKPEHDRKEPLKVIFQATSEIRSSIINATLIIIVVFVPLFFLSGIEGRLLKPLGITYIVSIAASLFVALTITPALCALLLSSAFKPGEGASPDGGEKDSIIVRLLKGIYRPFLYLSMNVPWLVILGGGLLMASTLWPLSKLGRSFLPSFNEGSLIVKIAAVPGTAIEKSAELGTLAEMALLRHPNITKVSRKTGRGDMDEHGKFSNESEIEAHLDLKGKMLAEVMADLRQSLAMIPGVMITFSQPISHRIDHMLSGTMANIAVKIFGPELFRLRGLAQEVYAQIKDTPGLVDLGVEQQIDISQIRINPLRHELAKHGLTIVDLAHAVEAAFEGVKVSRTLEGEKEFAIVVKYPDSVRTDIEAIKGMLVDTPLGQKVHLSDIAEVMSTKGPNIINRENSQRKMVIQANVAGRDLRGVYEEVKARITKGVNLPEGYSIEYGGQFESEAEATRMITLLSLVSLVFIFLFLYMEFGSHKESIIVMVNLPLALIGGVIAIYLTGGIINIASMVGFITLFGIATRNGILLVSHYHHLMKFEGKNLVNAVYQGSMERLRPVVMTALTAGLALVPFAIAADKPGNEILSPMAVVILGGLLSSTALNMIILPSLFLKFGEIAIPDKVEHKHDDKAKTGHDDHGHDNGDGHKH